MLHHTLRSNARRCPHLATFAAPSARALTTTAANNSAVPRTLTIGLIPADGIGREVIPAAQQVLEALPSQFGLKFNFVHCDAGFEYFQKHGEALPQKTVDVLRADCDGALFGAVSSPSHKVAGYSSPIVALRKHLDLYANVRPVISTSPGGADSPSAGPAARPVDMLIIRENTECLYVKREKQYTDANGEVYAVAERLITQKASERAGRMAFQMALARDALRAQQPPTERRWTGLPKVTIVHKSNVLSVTDGLWRETIRRVHETTPAFRERVLMEEQLVDSMVYRMFREPQVFDVVVAPNLYGDILSDGAAALVGSLGLVPSANVGDNFVMGEPVHGSAPDIAGQHKANPVAAIRSAALLLENIGLPAPALAIYTAVDKALQSGLLTPDLGGKATTEEVTGAICRNL
ncbi:homoisocitrate dehydrogenase [Tieghemiomyces parasiticus]|uniref:Homoisocitrate dehydrogenase n=1 Tax=Tieghemiomyces parasiticus TaxID=78921 RepID=A0A9W7ZT92_9FUNG|nr:homoisocitrate dehydrogenase [Tieghemiomyces parasiticus]